MPKEIHKLPGKARMPVRLKLLELNGDYTGWQVKARVNPTIETVGKIASGEVELLVPALNQILIEWNFVDEKGDYLGDPSEETINKLPMDLINSIANKITEELTTIPQA